MALARTFSVIIILLAALIFGIGIYLLFIATSQVTALTFIVLGIILMLVAIIFVSV